MPKKRKTLRKQSRKNLRKQSKSFELKKATIKQPANYFFNNLVTLEKNIIVAGDHTTNGSIEGR